MKALRSLKLPGFMALVMVIVLAITMVASASELTTSVADASAPYGSVTLNPGKSEDITITFTISGKQGSPASFQVYQDWTLSGGQFVGSNPQTFDIPARSDPNAPATVRTTTGKITVAPDQTAGGPFTLSIGIFDLDTNGTAKLGAGVPATYQVTVEVPTPSDTAAPTINCTVPGLSPWYGQNVQVSCTAEDNESGLAKASDSSFTLSTDVSENNETEGANTGTYNVCDKANNCVIAGPFGPFKVDLKAPVVECGSADGTWHATDQSVSCTATDGGSGLANPVDASFTLNTNVDPETETNVANTNSQPIADAVGNTATAGPVGPFMIDKKAPQLQSCDEPDGLWHKADVTLNCTYTDNGSGAGSLTVALSTNVALGEETDNAIASANGAQAVDAVGNLAASPEDIKGNKVDKKAPNVTCGFSDGKWHADDQTVTCTATDDGSGQATPASFTLSTSVADGTESANASTGSQEVVDAVGNTVTAGPVSGFKIDKKAPVVSCPTADTIWHSDNQSVTCTATDAGSGPASQTVILSTSVLTGTETDSATTNSQSVVDAVGNSSTVGPVGPFKIDKKAPVVSCPGPDTDWHATDQSVTCTATDGGSGPASQTVTLSTSVTAGTETDSAYTGSQDVFDAVNNKATTGPVGPFKIDKKAPIITISTPADKSTYVLNQSATSSFNCDDKGSGVQSCQGPAVVDTSSVGSKAFTVTATDKVGNSATATVNYNVTYRFDGFLQPINDTAHQTCSGCPTSIFKAGSTVPVKFQLKDANGKIVQTSALPVWIVPLQGVPMNQTVDETIYGENPTPGSSYRWDATSQQYIFNWGTSKIQAGYWWRIGVKLDDGTTYYVIIGLR